jgi:TetR/AcrR family transcriptional regulator
MSSAPGTQEKRRVGRPRKRENGALGADPKEQILRAASLLFAERGIAEVSMLEIAEAAGLGQSSLYYWFRRKELIVAELLQQVNRLPLAYARQQRVSGESADVQLYRIVHFDVLNVCAFPLEITEERRELVRTLRRLIQDGIVSGCFRKVDATLTAMTIIAQDESVQNWHSSAIDGKVRIASAADPALRYQDEEVADFVATQTLAGLLAAESKLDLVRRRAMRVRPEVSVAKPIKKAP